jgi:hypothetical protein
MSDDRQTPHELVGDLEKTVRAVKFLARAVCEMSLGRDLKDAAIWQVASEIEEYADQIEETRRKVWHQLSPHKHLQEIRS